MGPVALLSMRLTELKAIVDASLSTADAASRGFAERIFALDNGGRSRTGPGMALTIGGAGEECADLAYGGIPSLALLGFRMGSAAAAGIPTPGEASDFIAAVERLRGRPSKVQADLCNDDVALLGIADGIAAMVAQAGGNSHHAPLREAVDWLVGLGDCSGAVPSWSRRVGWVAAELLDPRGRLRVEVAVDDPESMALDLCLRRGWTSAFKDAGQLAGELRRNLMVSLLTLPSPPPGDLVRAAVWTFALSALTYEAVAVLVPDVDEVVRRLEATQGGLKRWVWEAQSRRADAGPAQWLIDNEAHVQAYLWAMLYPMFRTQLLDEQYLPGYGLKQPRYDFGVTGLKLIIEVKIVRNRSDFARIEEEIAGDLGLYFSDPARFDRMVAYIYDDCDGHHPELYDTLRNALMSRDGRVVGVVVVRRPGMVPNRVARQGNEAKTEGVARARTDSGRNAKTTARRGRV